MSGAYSVLSVNSRIESDQEEEGDTSVGNIWKWLSPRERCWMSYDRTDAGPIFFRQLLRTGGAERLH
jgi:hypothetical protein